MLVFDQLKRNDPQLRLLTLFVLGGLSILLVGLWWVQIVCAREYEGHLEAQSYRTVRIPAMRGKILDRDGEVLAENRATYDVSLYLEDLRSLFDTAYDRAYATWRRANTNRMTLAQKNALREYIRYNVTSNEVYQISRRLQQPLLLDETRFRRHYQARRALPFTIVEDLAPAQIARFAEQPSDTGAANLEMQTVRYYPHGATAAHVLGYVRANNDSVPGEDAYFSYRLPDSIGVVGIEGDLDQQLHGHAGVESVLVNNLGYRQEEKVVSEPDPGWNVVLTLDLDIQQAAERAMQSRQGPEARAAAVVMDVHTGEVLAMASSPAFDPNDFAQGISTEKYHQLQQLEAEKNRASFENYAPGSIFKTVVALAALENGLDPNAIYRVQPNPENPGRGIFYVGRRGIRDTAPPGDYNFKKAFIHSSNSYFITNGMRAGIEKIIRIGRKFHLGERTGLLPGQETRGNFPTLDRVRSRWSAGDTANVCIGQGVVDVTPIQMAVMVSAIANGGKVLWPRLVSRIEPQDPLSGDAPQIFASGEVRDTLDVSARTLKTVREAMLADVEDADGTGTRAAVPGLRICGKTGTAQVQDSRNNLIGYNFWFASYAPYDSPRYAVVVLVQTGPGSGSGGATCAPIAHDIYAEIQKLENANRGRTLAAKD